MVSTAGVILIVAWAILMLVLSVKLERLTDRVAELEAQAREDEHGG